jgi:hypothetical protein
MKRLHTVMLLALVVMPAGAYAQASAPAAPRNLRFDIVIAEGTAPASTTKTLTLMMTDADAFGSLRNNARIPAATNAPATTVTDKDGKVQTVPAAAFPVPLNIDVREVRVLPNEQVRARITIEYQPYVANSRAQPAAINGSAAMVFDNGRKATVLQTVDPVSDRRTTVDVTATILK